MQNSLANYFGKNLRNKNNDLVLLFDSSILKGFLFVMRSHRWWSCRAIYSGETFDILSDETAGEYYTVSSA